MEPTTNFLLRKHSPATELKKHLAGRPGTGDQPGHLMIGDVKSGLDHLHRAEEQFEMRRDLASLTLALENEVAYSDHAKKRGEAAAVRERMEQLEAAK